MKKDPILATRLGDHVSTMLVSLVFGKAWSKFHKFDVVCLYTCNWQRFDDDSIYQKIKVLGL